MCTETEVKYIRKVVTAGSFSSLSIHFTKYNILSAYNHIHACIPDKLIFTNIVLNLIQCMERFFNFEKCTFFW